MKKHTEIAMSQFGSESDSDLGWLYRYDDVQYAASIDEFDNPIGEGRLEIVLRKYEIIKKTRCGVRISDTSAKGKFVNFEFHKKFACLTKEDAMKSFIARKKRQTGILKYQLNRAMKAHEIGLRMLRDNTKD